MQVYTKTESGFGDFLAQYLRDGVFKYLKCLKQEIGFKPSIINLDYTHNACSLNVAELNPFFKSKQRPWRTWDEYNNDNDIVKLETLFDWRKIKCETPLFYLDEQDIKWIESLPKQYYCLHVHAGNKERRLLDWLPQNTGMEDLIKVLVQKMPVVLLGGSGERFGMNEHCREEYHWQHPCLINAMNRISARAQCEAVKHCTRFIGSFSCYEVVASYLGVDSVVGCPTLWANDIKEGVKDAYFKVAHDQENMQVLNWDESNFYERLTKAAVNGL